MRRGFRSALLTSPLDLAGPFPCKLPLVPGHEGAGEIVALGTHTQTALRIGSRVGIKALGSSCLQCDYCRAGKEILCAHSKNTGYGVDGTFQQYAVSWVSHLTPIPDGVPLEVAAPVLCAGVTVYAAFKGANVKPGDYVLIAGAGGERYDSQGCGLSAKLTTTLLPCSPRRRARAPGRPVRACDEPPRDRCRHW